MLAQLKTLADDRRLDPVHLPEVEWFADEVRAARSQGRLDELADLFREAGIRRRRWRDGPAALTAGVALDEDDTGYPDDKDEDAAGAYAEYDDEGQDDAAPAAVVLATPGAPMTWADAFRALGWRLTPTTGGCQVVTEDGHCAADTVGWSVTDGRVDHGWVCRRHYEALATVIGDHNRRIA
jgi:hypothetical protein